MLSANVHVYNNRATYNIIINYSEYNRQNLSKSLGLIPFKKSNDLLQIIYFLLSLKMKSATLAGTCHYKQYTKATPESNTALS